jgi:hypothetical protein
VCFFGKMIKINENFCPFCPFFGHGCIKDPLEKLHPGFFQLSLGRFWGNDRFSPRNLRIL